MQEALKTVKIDKDHANHKQELFACSLLSQIKYHHYLAKMQRHTELWGSFIVGGKKILQVCSEQWLLIVEVGSGLSRSRGDIYDLGLGTSSSLSLVCSG